MCGIAGYIGKKELNPRAIQRTLTLMQNRGPDVQIHRRVKDHNKNIDLLHSRLSIIDLDRRADQPFFIGDYVIIFNGEIYNYIKLRNALLKEGVTLRTTSDTEVLLYYYIKYGEKCVDYFEGMWSFVIYDPKKGGIFLSRDRFGEKPLFYYKSRDGIYFGSEVKFLTALSEDSFTVNQKHLYRYMVNGFRSLHKSGELFYNELREVDRAKNMFIDSELRISSETYWSPRMRSSSMTLEDAIDGVKQRLHEALKMRLRSDVPLAFCLSGGVDSSLLASIASKVMHYDVSTFSIIDNDERYDERDNIYATVNDLNCQHRYIEISTNDSLLRLKNLIGYHGAPLSTISYYIHSLLLEEMANDGYKVAISGTAADEIFTGYYDHFNLHLNEIAKSECYGQRLEEWEMHIAPHVRNPYLKNPKLYSEKPNERGHIYLNHEEFESYLKVDFAEEFKEEFFCPSLLRNRMLNELFYEIVPVILKEDDLNAMMNSVENRSPYLDSKLFEFVYSIPAEYLISGGYAKYILREAGKGILNDKVRLDRKKKGFNANVATVFDLSRKDVFEYLLDDSKIYEYVKRDCIENVIKDRPMKNSFSKFLFNFINAKLFLEMN